MGRFLSRDTWAGDVNRPGSLNRWGYTEGNVVNYTDPTGKFRVPCVAGWNAQAIRWRVDEAEKYVKQTSEYLDTYTAAGVAIQCAGWDNPFDPNSGVGISQVSRNQASTKWGRPIYEYIEVASGRVGGRSLKFKVYVNKNGKLIPVIRGYGLKLDCDQEPLDPNDPDDAVILMKRRIQLVTDECKKCTDTDIYIAAALAQNGPGFSHVGMKEIPKMTDMDKDWARKTYGIYPDNTYPLVNRNWFSRFHEDAKDNDMVNTKTQLNRFVLVVNELQMRGWPLPPIDTITIGILQRWQKGEDEWPQ